MPFSTALRATSPAAIITSGLEVLVHEVMAAITTSPSVRVKVPAGPFRLRLAPSSARPFVDGDGVLVPGLLHLDQVDPILGRRGPASAGCTVDMSSSRLDAVDDLGRVVPPQALVAVVLLDGRHQLLGPCR